MTMATTFATFVKECTASRAVEADKPCCIACYGNVLIVIWQLASSTGCIKYPRFCDLDHYLSLLHDHVCYRKSI